MSHPVIENKTGFAADLLFLADEDGRSVVVPLVQATYDIDEIGLLTLARKQPVPNLAGEYWGDPATSSLKYEMQIAFVKLATDVVLLGHAVAPHANSTESQVGIRVGPVQKLAKVSGDRKFVKRLAGAGITRPEPFERIPLRYERAFGGWDRRHSDPDKHRCEPFNPVGVGFRDVSLPADEEMQLPNFEDPSAPFRRYGEMLPAVGFGFVAPHWQPRAGFAGTYDAAWDQSRKPLVPKDFDRRFFNAASPGLVTPSPLRGDEPVVVLGVTPNGRVGFNLPGVLPPVCRVDLRGSKCVPLQTALDTVIVDADALTLTLLWRAHVCVRHGPHDVVAVTVGTDVSV